MANKAGIYKIVIESLSNKPNKRFHTFFILSLLLTSLFICSAYQTLTKGLFLWGINNDVVWGFDITNFVFWIGVGHSGTLISAILFLLNQKWRTNIFRISEMMTISAIILALLYPMIHTGRPWFAINWLFPLFNQMALMPNFKSPLIWDVFAILTYLISSILFIYVGMIPDMKILHGRINGNLKNKIYNYLSFYWIGTREQWANYKSLYLLFAGVLTTVVITVHSIVSFDFSVTFIKGWHSTIMPPYFVVGAILSGCAFLNILLIIFRYIYKLEDIITNYHFSKINKIIIFTSQGIGYVYLLELLFNSIEGKTISSMFLSNPELLVIVMILFVVVIPQLLFIKKVRTNILTSFILSVLILIGMWLERFLIIVRGQELSSVLTKQALYYPSLTDISLFAGSFGVFLLIILLLSRNIPIVSISEYEDNGVNQN